MGHENEKIPSISVGKTADGEKTHPLIAIDKNQGP